MEHHQFTLTLALALALTFALALALALIGQTSLSLLTAGTIIKE